MDLQENLIQLGYFINEIWDPFRRSDLPKSHSLKVAELKPAYGILLWQPYSKLIHLYKRKGKGSYGTTLVKKISFQNIDHIDSKFLILLFIKLWPQKEGQLL